jgi:hypothetical protein
VPIYYRRNGIKSQIWGEEGRSGGKTTVITILRHEEAEFGFDVL